MRSLRGAAAGRKNAQVFARLPFRPQMGGEVFWVGPFGLGARGTAGEVVERWRVDVPLVLLRDAPRNVVHAAVIASGAGNIETRAGAKKRGPPKRPFVRKVEDSCRHSSCG